MKRQEIVAIYKVISATYPNFYKNDTEEQMKDFINLWLMMFEEDNPNLVTEAVKTAIQTCEFPPTIAHIKKAIKTMQSGENNEKYPTEEEAWNKVHKAMSNGYYNSVEEFEKFDDITKRLIGSHTVLKEYSLMDTSQINTVVKSNFMRSYRSMIENKMQFDNLPSSAKKLSEELNCDGQVELEDKEMARRSIQESTEKH